MKKAHHRSAFSLVELSIVLVILGLLVGGVLSGQSLIHASELRAVTTEFQTYSTAIGSFRDKYFAMPGDMPNALSFGTAWYANGDGNGKVQNNSMPTTNEVDIFWVHLASANLIQGKYTPAGGTPMTRGGTSPASKLNNGMWNIAYFGSVGYDCSTADTGNNHPTGNYIFAGNYGHAFLYSYGTATTGYDELGDAPILTTQDAWNLDSKMDDGKPDTGSVLANKDFGSTTPGVSCVDKQPLLTVMPPANYDLKTTGVVCAMVFKSGY